MIELRKDYILDRWSYIALDRENRLKQFKESGDSKTESVCFFCPGNENMTPPEIGRIGTKDSWKIRWFPNKFPITESGVQNNIDISNKFLTKGNAFGYHEVIAETADHKKQLWNLDESELCELLKVYASRISELSEKDGVEYVQLFKNSGSEAGTSIIHSHTQIVTTSIIPGSVVEKVAATKKFVSCPYCEIITIEKNCERFIYENDDFIVFAPFAPRFNYETCIFPKKHYKGISELQENEFANLASAFKKVLSKLAVLNTPYNFYLHYSPESEDLHFHFEITPRLNKWAGFELATDSYVVTVSPENTAKFFKE